MIDDAIVVRENILRWVHKGYSPKRAASIGTMEVVLPVLATGATILCVFMPVAYASGIIGRFFREFGLTGRTLAVALGDRKGTPLQETPTLRLNAHRHGPTCEKRDCTL